MVRLVALDVETTGFTKRREANVAENHRIIEVAAVEIIDNKLTGRSYQSYVNPSQAIDEKAEKVHGISDADLIGKPRFDCVWKDLSKFIGDAPLVFHNAQFDIAFLDKEFSLLTKSEQPTNTFIVFDTLIACRDLHPYEDNSLSTLATRYNLKKTKRHSALGDAFTTAELFTLINNVTV